MHYIRFLKTPQLHDDASTTPFVKLVLTIETDLGDDVLNGDVDLVVSATPASGDTGAIVRKDLTWRYGDRALPIKLDLRASYRRSPFRISLHCKDSIYEGSTVRDGNVVMPHIIPVASSLICPEKGKRKAEKLAVRALSLSNNIRISIVEDTGYSIARHIWDAGLALCFFIEHSFVHSPTALRSLDRCLRKAGSPLNVIELGTGCGIAGIALAAIVPNCRVILTDIEDAASRNIPSSDGSVSFAKLDWFSTPPERVLNNSFDLILASDSTYNPDSSPALVKTICRLHDQSKSALVVIASKARHPSEDVFFELMIKENFAFEKSCVLAPSVAGPSTDPYNCEKVDIYAFTRAYS